MDVIGSLNNSDHVGDVRRIAGAVERIISFKLLVLALDRQWRRTFPSSNNYVPLLSFFTSSLKL